MLVLRITTPDDGLAPLNGFFALVLVCNSKSTLGSEPLLGKLFHEVPGKVIENGILDVG